MTSTVDMREETGGRPVPKAKVNHQYNLLLEYICQVCWWDAVDRILLDKDFTNLQFGIVSALLSLENQGLLTSIYLLVTTHYI